MKRVSVALVAMAICTLLASQASAAANLALRGIGLKAGVVNPEEVDMTLGLGLIVDLGTVHPNIALESYAGFWSQTEDFYGSEFRVRDIAIGAKGKYLFKISNPSVQPFAGAGLGTSLPQRECGNPTVLIRRGYHSGNIRGRHRHRARAGSRRRASHRHRQPVLVRRGELVHTRERRESFLADGRRRLHVRPLASGSEHAQEGAPR